jgi:hypothetical protein
MARRESFDNGHGMDYYRLLPAVNAVSGAALGVASFGGVGAAITGAAIMPVAAKLYAKHKVAQEKKYY